MIDEQETRLQFGYYSESLSKGSNKEVYVICEECGYKRTMKFYIYVETHGRCQSCAQSGKNNPFYGKKHSRKTRIKMSKNHVNISGKNNPNYGKIVSNETRNKMSKAHIGKQLSEETKYKMSKNHFDMSKENSPNWKGGRKLARARANIKRRKLFGFIPHNIPHENFHGHHVDFNHVIFIPKELHTSIPHSVINNKNMNLINNLVCDWYLEFQGV